MRLSIVIPTYNEKDNLHPLVSQIEEALRSKVEDYEVLFVDDSTDETPAVLAEMSNADPRVRYIHREERKGLASAVVCGFENARGDVIAVMDADLQHPPRLLSEMLDRITDGADIVLPSRYIGGGESEGLSFIRTLASKNAKYAARLLLPSMKKVSDPMSGFFMFQRHILDDVQLNPVGWKILMEILVMGNYRRVVEIPYGFEKRNAGESKLRFKVTMEYFWHILSLMARGGQEKRRYALILSCLLGIAVDWIVFGVLGALWALSLYVAATLSVSVAGAAQCFCCAKLIPPALKKKRPFPYVFFMYALQFSVLVIAKNAGMHLLVFGGFSFNHANFFSAALAMVLSTVLYSRLFTW